MTTTAFISADYDEFKPETLRAFEVQVSDGSSEHSQRFQTYEEASDYASAVASKVFTLSSVDNYAADLRTAAENRSTAVH